MQQDLFGANLKCHFLVSVFSPWIALHVGDIEPFHRGFFCDDESLKHPYFESTVSNTHLILLGVGLPILMVSEHNKIDRFLRVSQSSMQLQSASMCERF